MKQFDVTIKYRTVAGRIVKFAGRVAAVPGVDIWQTIREVAVTRNKKGQMAHIVAGWARPV